MNGQLCPSLSLSLSFSLSIFLSLSLSLSLLSLSLSLSLFLSLSFPLCLSVCLSLSLSLPPSLSLSVCLIHSLSLSLSLSLHLPLSAQSLGQNGRYLEDLPPLPVWRRSIQCGHRQRFHRQRVLQAASFVSLWWAREDSCSLHYKRRHRGRQKNCVRRSWYHYGKQYSSDAAIVISLPTNFQSLQINQYRPQPKMEINFAEFEMV